MVNLSDSKAVPAYRRQTFSVQQIEIKVNFLVFLLNFNVYNLVNCFNCQFFVGNTHQHFKPLDNLEDIKEGLRQGVTNVAGKLSSLANGVMTSIQDRYGY